MKTVKIILVVLVLGIIGFFLFKWTSDSNTNNNNGNVELTSSNQFIRKISGETDSLKTLPRNEFSFNYYKGVQAELENYFKKGFLGTDSIQGKQAFENLSKTLFATYVPKFVEETFYVFKQSSWKNSDIRFIKDQINTIKDNPYFDSENSSYLNRFKEIENIISQYYEVAAFVVRCRKYPSNLNYSVDSRFPIKGVKRKLTKAKQYLNSQLGNKYVNNVRWLKNALKEIPQKMYQKNYEFLERQIKQNSGRYSDTTAFKTQADYSRKIYQPLKESLNEFDNKMYGVIYNPTFKNDYDELKNLLNEDNEKAGNYFRKKWEQQKDKKER